MERVFEAASSLLSHEKKKISGIDVKISGGLVYPGSVYGGCSSSPHKCGMPDDQCLFRGAPYTWIKSPASVFIASVPTWLRSYIKRKKDNTQPPKSSKTLTTPLKQSLTPPPSIDYDKIKEVVCLLKPRADPYNEWRDTIWCIKGLGYDISIAQVFSKKAKNYDANSVENIWNYYDERVVWNWGTIRNWLKEILSEDDYRTFVLKYFPDLSKEDMSLQGDWGLTKKLTQGGLLDGGITQPPINIMIINRLD